MKKISLLTGCVIFLPVLLLSQPYVDKKIAVTWTPTVMAPPFENQFGLQIGAQYKIANSLNLLTEVTIPTGKDSDPKNGISNKKYFRIKPELRYFIFKEKTFDYVGLQFSYAFRSFTKSGPSNFYYDHLPHDSVVWYDKADINSPIFTASVQFGTDCVISQHFVVDLFCGFGVRIITTEHTNVTNASVKAKYTPICNMFPFVPEDAYHYNGNLTRFHMNVGFRLMYFF
jgi:hypothetical protein